MVKASHFPSPCQLALFWFISMSMAWSTEKLPGRWRGGNCWKVVRNWPTIVWAGTKMKACSTYHVS